MKEKPASNSEIQKLENLWSGEFGDQYTDRNIEAGTGREEFWYPLLEKYKFHRVLEVGCNVGANLKWFAEKLPPQEIYGLDINLKALGYLRSKFPQLNTFWAQAREIPFRDQWFDLVFTAGVLIHQPERALPVVMSEVVRCSRRYILTLEYFSDGTVDVNYRGQQGTLFKRDYGKIFIELFPNLELLDRGELTKESGWDEVTFWLFEKK